MPFKLLPIAALTVCLAAAVVDAQQPAPRPTTDLDALMERALAHRDQNWKKIDQYVLDERVDVELRGPGNALVLGDHREYAWFMRDGFFVQSPVRANGVAVSESDRRDYEQRWLKREQQRQAARERRQAAGGGGDAAAAQEPAASDLNGIVTQTREPGFIQAGYFLEFKFEPGNYYVAGRDTLNGRQVLKVEYYPSKLFDERTNRRAQNRDQDRNPRQEELREKMNKTSLVTLWVDPATADIIKYTFDNLGLDFIPGGWLFRFEDFKATVTMIEPFAGVWLPGKVDMQMSGSLATGRHTLDYTLEYYGHRQAEVKSNIIPRPQR